MFLKPFKVKAHNQLKSSEKRKLRVEVGKHFPQLQDEDINGLIPLKEDVSCMRLFTHKGDAVKSYMSGGCPFAFLVEGRGPAYMLPSVYLCWLHAGLDLGVVFHTTRDVMHRLQGGADLMMPGVIYREKLTERTFGAFEAGAVATVVCRGAVIAVGRTALSSTDLYMAGGRGKAVICCHVLEDFLWAAGDKKSPPYKGTGSVSAPSTTTPVGGGLCGGSGGVVVVETGAPGGGITHQLANARLSGPSSISTQRPSTSSTTSTQCSSTAGSTQGSSAAGSEGSGAQSPMSYSGAASSPACVDQQPSSSPDLASLASDDTSAAATNGTAETTTEDMDALLRHCFLKALKAGGSKLVLPLLTSTFYAKHVLPACPDGVQLDVKRSSFKKISKFLDAMASEGLLVKKEAQKGVEHITSVNCTHELVLDFRYRKSETTPKPIEVGGEVFVPPTFEEVYGVSGNVAGFFNLCGHSKGAVLTRGEVRDIVTSFVKRKNLVDPKSRQVNLDAPALSQAILTPKDGMVLQLPWDQVFSRLLGRMNPAVRISRGDRPPLIKKGVLTKIEMATAKRSGNKKVTLIYNLPEFGIDEHEFARQIQVIAAASTSVGPAEHKKAGTTQVLVQGNATPEVARLLEETYQIPKKYIKGLELIPKKKR